MSAPIGIGVIAYYGTHDLVRCLRSIRQHTALVHALYVCDNTESNRLNVDAGKAFGATVLHDGTNHGCSRGRNLLWQVATAEHPEMEYLVIMDQDVRVLDGWLGDMLEVMLEQPRAGIVAWPLANMGRLPMREDGCISAAASVCNLHRVAAIEAVGGWDPFFTMYRFDSLFAQRINQAGYRTFLVTKYFRPEIRWEDQPGRIIHDHPHQGVRRNPKWRDLQRESDTYYRNLKAREGWADFDPWSEPREEWQQPLRVVARS